MEIKHQRISISCKRAIREKLRTVLLQKGFMSYGYRMEDPYLKISVEQHAFREVAYTLHSFTQAKGIPFYYINEDALAAIQLIPKEAVIDFIVTLPSNRKPKHQ